MADVIYDRLSGLPPEQGERFKDMGDGTFALVGMTVAGYPPLLSLSAVATTGPGLSMDNVGVRNNHSLVVTTSAGVSAGTVVLQGSMDGVNWINAPLSSVSTVAASTTYIGTAATLTPLRFLRANITVAITGGTIMAWVGSAG